MDSMKTAILVGGSGYIGKFLLREFLTTDYFAKYLVYDINPLKGFDDELRSGKVVYIKADVRNKLPTHNLSIDVESSWMYNLAAVHREPGHDFKEYFDTNIPGAKNVNQLAREMGIKNIFFTSSIAPYGKSLNQKTEKSTLYPETAYGISKALAEEIHQQWLAEDKSRKLIIVRPSVIFGPKDPGNVYRMIKAIKRGTFVLPNKGNVIKAYGYVYGLVESILFTMNKSDRIIIYNYAENPLVPLREMTKIVKQEFNYRKPTLGISVNLLAIVAFFIHSLAKLTGKKTAIHPVRVKKAGFPTNIKPDFLIYNNFVFKYDFKSSLKHWKSVSPEDF